MEPRSVQLGGLNLARIHGPLLFFGPPSFVCWVTRRLRCSFALALPPPLTQVLPRPPRPPPPHPQAPSKKAPTRLGSPTRSIPLNRWTGELPRTRWHWCVEGACEEVDWVWDVERVDKEEQEIVLTFELCCLNR